MVSDHVLPVGDEGSVRQVLGRWIKNIGYEKVEADCAEAGLDAMIANPAAVVFCDVQMPGQGGLWLRGVLRARFPIPGTTILRPGILAYLTKPFDTKAWRVGLRRSMVWHTAAVAAGPQATHRRAGR